MMSSGEAMRSGLPASARSQGRRARDAQVRDREADQARLRLRAAARRPFVADLAARAGRRAGERRDRGRVVVRLDLHQTSIGSRPRGRCRRRAAKKRVVAGRLRTTAALSGRPRARPRGSHRCCGSSRTATCRVASPSTTQAALKILWRQCSEFACANIISSTSVGSRPTLDPHHPVEPAGVRDVGRLARPRRDRAEPRHDPARVRPEGLLRAERAVREQPLQHDALLARERPPELHEVDETCAGSGEGRVRHAERREAPRQARGRQRGPTKVGPHGRAGRPIAAWGQAGRRT
jgi:hypothetical protein